MTFKYHLRETISAVLEACGVMYILIICFASPAALSAVVSDSMVPNMHKGDLILVSNHNTTYDIGDIVVFQNTAKGPTIVHRIIKRQKACLSYVGSDYEQPITCNVETFVTKGDNNPVDDTHGIYPASQNVLLKEQIIGKVVVTIPLLGKFATAISDLGISMEVKPIYVQVFFMFCLLLWSWMSDNGLPFCKNCNERHCSIFNK